MENLIASMGPMFANPLIALALYLWTLPWKGVALWKAAARKEKVWFIALLLLNTLAILEILYIFVFSNDQIVAKLKKYFSGKPTSTN